MFYRATVNGIASGVVKRRLEAAALAFQQASGAEDITVTNELLRFARIEGLLSNLRFYPKKASQNAGSGPTVYGAGNLTANNMSLFNSPTWGEVGISYNGTNQYGTIADFLESDTSMFFARVNKADFATGDQYVFAQWDTNANRSQALIQASSSVANNPMTLLRSSDGSFTTGGEGYSGNKTGLGSDSCFVCEWIDGGGRNFWVNKSAQSLTLTLGSNQTSSFNTNVNVTFGSSLSSGSPSSFSAMQGTAFAILTGAVTTIQRETLTDLINEF